MSRICGRCGKKVYAAEERLGLNQSWHVRCFTCAICNRTLDSVTLAENRGLNQIYCKVCYRKKFATKGYGYGPNEPTLLAFPSSISLMSCNEQDARAESEEKVPYKSPEKQPSKNAAESVRSINQPSNTSNASEIIRAGQSSSKPTLSQVISEKMSPRPMTSSNSCTHNPGSSSSSQKRITTPVKSKNKRGEFSENESCCNNYSNIQDANIPQLPCPGCIEDGGVKKLAAPRYPAKTLESKRKPLNSNLTIENSKSRSRPHQQKHTTESHAAPPDKGNNRSEFTAPSKYGAGEPCKRCKRPVFWAEMKLGHYGAYHQECFTCCCCGKPLESTTVNENQGEIFCKGCYRRYFGTHGIGYGLGAGALQTP
ncbi:unnamed protein product [Allacma fusca]|uniref:LIM zinc-binding domain-containing protein n=1 Tax=Allacma fusca TaxID=39272 RepID=A0A8J2LDS7_9HEXA|nr:unnamed protein product [Allacma fusca]